MKQNNQHISESVKQLLALRCLLTSKQPFFVGGSLNLGDNLQSVNNSLKNNPYRTSSYLGRELTEATDMARFGSELDSSVVIEGKDFMLSQIDFSKYFEELSFSSTPAKPSHSSLKDLWENYALPKAQEQQPDSKASAVEIASELFELKLKELMNKDIKTFKEILAETCFYNKMSPVLVSGFNPDDAGLFETESINGIGFELENAHLNDMISGGELKTSPKHKGSLIVEDALFAAGIGDDFIAAGYNSTYTENAEHVNRLYSTIDICDQVRNLQKTQLLEVLKKWERENGPLPFNATNSEIQKITGPLKNLTGQAKQTTPTNE